MEDGRWDLLEWLGPDTSACVMNYLNNPADVARAAAVSKSWCNFGIRAILLLFLKNSKKPLVCCSICIKLLFCFYGWTKSVSDFSYRTSQAFFLSFFLFFSFITFTY